MMAVSVFSVVYPPLSCRTSPPQGGRMGTRHLSALCQHSLAEASRRLTPSREPVSDRTCMADRQPHPLSPLVGEMPGRAEGGELALSHPQAGVTAKATPC
uniref:Propionyl-coenzyme A carboxylase alpha polypeptide n=1 Tax=Agrobacterium albertimagni TaxID=147266 RepID=A0A7C1T5J3_9HYPH